MIDWLLRDRETGEIVIGQFPNLSLGSFVVLRVAEWVTRPHGDVRDVVHWAGTAALVWWALDEVIRGVNPFRRMLGGIVLVGVMITVV